MSLPIKCKNESLDKNVACMESNQPLSILLSNHKLKMNSNHEPTHEVFKLKARSHKAISCTFTLSCVIFYLIYKLGYWKHNAFNFYE